MTKSNLCSTICIVVAITFLQLVALLHRLSRGRLCAAFTLTIAPKRDWAQFLHTGISMSHTKFALIRPEIVGILPNTDIRSTGDDSPRLRCNCPTQRRRCDLSRTLQALRSILDRSERLCYHQNSRSRGGGLGGCAPILIFFLGAERPPEGATQEAAATTAGAVAEPPPPTTKKLRQRLIWSNPLFFQGVAPNRSDLWRKFFTCGASAASGGAAPWLWPLRTVLSWQRSGFARGADGCFFSVATFAAAL